MKITIEHEDKSFTIDDNKDMPELIKMQKLAVVGFLLENLKTGYVELGPLTMLQDLDNPPSNLNEITELDKQHVHWHICKSCDIRWSHKGNDEGIRTDDDINQNAHQCPQCHKTKDFHPKKMQYLIGDINYPNWKGSNLY